jgi:kynurenine formamidase
MPVYPGDPQPKFEKNQTIEKDGVNVTRITIGSHTGTHVDAPWHFFQHGNTIDKEPLEKFLGQAVIVDMSEKQIGSGINADDLNRYLKDITIVDNDIILIYTGTSNLEDNDEKIKNNFTYLEPSAAEWLISHRIKCVGIDTFSIEKFGNKEAPVHKMLLAKGVGIIENLNSNLKQFSGRRMFFACLPLLLQGIDGSPARAVLIDI